MSETLTTKQLAERIACAVLAAAYDSGAGFQWECAHLHAATVLGVLHETGHWFCAVGEDDQPDRRLADVTQQDLFDAAAEVRP